MIDLHFHSTFSDGSLTPAQLVDKAVEVGLTAVALTDHDTVAGIAPFLDACEGKDITGITGVEISADVPRGTMHILGYYIDPGHAGMGDVLLRMQEGREDRNRRILEQLKELGLELTWEEVSGFSKEDVVGRPHIAMAMKARGYVKTIREAFDRYLAKEKPGYVGRFRLTPEDSISIIRQAGGVPVLSHPFTLGLGTGALRQCVARLKKAGLEGIEVYYSEHSKERVKKYKATHLKSGKVHRM